MYKSFCSNCGSTGHNHKKCKEPITSIGIICLKIDNENIRNKLITNFNLLEKVDFNIKLDTLDIIQSYYLKNNH